MRVKFVGDAQIKQAIKHLKNDKLEIYLLFDAVKDKNKYELKNTEKNVIHSVEKQADLYKVEIYHKSGQIDVSLKGILKENIVKNVQKTTKLTPTDSIRAILQLEDGNELAKALKGLNFPNDYFLYLDICRVKTALTPVNDKALFKTCFESLLPSEKLSIVAEFLDKADINLKLLDMNDLEPHKKTADIYNALGQQTYIDRVQALSGHLPLLGPNNYIYIDMQDWISRTVEGDLVKDINIFLKEFSIGKAEIDNVENKMINKFPLKPNHFRSDGNIQLTWDVVRNIFKDYKFKFSEYIHNCYFSEQVLGAAPHRIEALSFPAPPNRGNESNGYNAGFGLQEINTEDLSKKARTKFRKGYRTGINRKGYEDGKANRPYSDLTNLSDSDKGIYKNAYRNGIYYKGDHDVNDEEAAIIPECKQAYRRGRYRINEYHYQNKEQHIDSISDANQKCDDNNNHFFFCREDHNGKGEKSTFRKALYKLYRSTNNTDESYFSSGAYLPLHYTDIYDFINHEREYNINNIGVISEVNYKTILEGLTDNSKIGKLHKKIVEARGTVEDIVGTDPRRSNFAEYLWFLVFVNAETSRHAEWNYLARMSLAAVKNDFRTFNDIFKDEKHLNYVPKNHGAVQSMQRYKNQGLQHEVGLTTLLEREVEKKKKVLKEDILGVLTKADEDFIKQLEKYIIYAKDVFRQSVKDWLLVKLEQFNEAEKLTNKDNAAQLTKVAAEYENAKTTITNQTTPFTIKDNKVAIDGFVKSGNEIYTTAKLKDEFTLPDILKKLNSSLLEEKDIKNLKDKLALSEKDKTIKHYRDTLILQEKIKTPLKNLKLVEEQKTLTAKKTTLEKERDSVSTKQQALIKEEQGIEQKLEQIRNAQASNFAARQKLDSNLASINTTRTTLIKERDKIKDDEEKQTEREEIDRTLGLVETKLKQNKKDRTENEIAKSTLQGQLTVLQKEKQKLQTKISVEATNFLAKQKQIAVTSKLLAIVTAILNKPFADWDTLMTDNKKTLLESTQYKALEKHNTKFLKKLDLVIKELEFKLSDDNIKKEICNSFHEVLRRGLSTNIDGDRDRENARKNEIYAIENLLLDKLRSISVTDQTPDLTNLNCRFNIIDEPRNKKRIQEVATGIHTLWDQYKVKAHPARTEATFTALYNVVLKPQVDKWNSAHNTSEAKKTALQTEANKSDSNKNIEFYQNTLTIQEEVITAIKASFTAKTAASLAGVSLTKNAFFTSSLFKSWSGILTFHLLYHYYHGCYDLQADFKEKMRAGTHDDINKPINVMAKGKKADMLKWAKSKYGMLATLEHIPIMPT